MTLLFLEWQRRRRSSSILEQRRGGETLTLVRNMKEPSSNEQDSICLMTCYEEDTIPGIKSSYAQLFRISGQLVEQNDKSSECTCL